MVYYLTNSLCTGCDGRHILSTEEFPTPSWAEAHRVLILSSETGEKAPFHLSVEKRSIPDWMQLWNRRMDERTTLKLYRLKTVSWTCPWHQHRREAVKHTRQGSWLADEVWGAWSVKVADSLRSKCVCLYLFSFLCIRFQRSR